MLAPTSQCRALVVTSRSPTLLIQTATQPTCLARRAGSSRQTADPSVQPGSKGVSAYDADIPALSRLAARTRSVLLLTWVAGAAWSWVALFLLKQKDAQPTSHLILACVLVAWVTLAGSRGISFRISERYSPRTCIGLMRDAGDRRHWPDETPLGTGLPVFAKAKRRPPSSRQGSVSPLHHSGLASLRPIRGLGAHAPDPFSALVVRALTFARNALTRFAWVSAYSSSSYHGARSIKTLRSSVLTIRMRGMR